MPDGILGPMSEDGKFEDSDIPGAKDADEAYDLRKRDIVCTIGSLKIVGPRGFVSRFIADDLTEQQIEYGRPTVTREGSRICVVIPRTLVTTKTGTREVFRWFDYCCVAFGIEGDCAVGLEFLREEQATIEERSLLRPLFECATDVGGAIANGITDLIKAGVSSDQAAALLGGVFRSIDDPRQDEVSAQWTLAGTRSVGASGFAPVVPGAGTIDPRPSLKVSPVRTLQANLLTPSAGSPNAQGGA